MKWVFVRLHSGCIVNLAVLKSAAFYIIHFFTYLCVNNKHDSTDPFSHWKYVNFRKIEAF